MSATIEQKTSRLQARMNAFRAKQPAATPDQIARELGSAFADCCAEWESVEYYIAQPEAEWHLIAEIYHYAAELVRRQPRWGEIERYPQWQALLAQPKRKLPVSHYRVPAYYVDTLLSAGAGKTVVRCLESRALKATDHFDRLASRRDQSIDGFLASRENRPEWLEHFSKSTYPSVRLRVAQNEYTSPDTLRVLCVDENRKIAETATRHPKFPADAAQLVAVAEEASVNAKLDRLESLDWQSLGEFFTNPELPSEVLAILARRDDASIRFACSMHPNAPEAVWRESLVSPEPWRRAAVALNPAVPEEILRELANNDDFDIAFALASNPDLPEDLHLRIANHAERAIRHLMADRVRSIAVWSEVIKHPGPKKIQNPLEHFLALAIDPKTPAKKLNAFYAVVNRNRSSGEVLTTAISNAIALHPHFPPERLAEFRYYLPWFEQQNRSISLMALEGAKLPQARPHDDWKLTTGQIGRLPGHVANHMLVHGDVRVRRIAAGHPRCDRALLIPLLFSGDTHTLKKVAERDHMPRFFYEILWGTSQDSVRAILAQNPAASRRHASFASSGSVAPKVAAAATKVVLSKGKVKVGGTKKERAELAENAADLAALTALARDKMPEVRVALAKNPEIAESVEIYSSFAKDTESSVRQALAHNRRLPWDAAATLARDVDPAVVKAVVSGLHRFPVELTEALERELLARGGIVAETLAQHTCSESLQLGFVTTHPKQLAHNLRCTLAAAIALLRHGELDPSKLSRLVGNLRRAWGEEAAGEFATKAVRLGLDALLAPTGDALNTYSILFPDATEEERERYRERAAAFVQSQCEKGEESLLDACGRVMSLACKCRNSPAANDLILELFDSPYIPRGAVTPILPTLIYACRALPADLQRRFASVNIEDVRAALAAHTDLEQDVIAKLSADECESVRRTLVEYSPSVAPLLVKDPSASVRAMVAQHAGIELQDALSADANPEVLSELAANDCCKPAILERLVRHKKMDVRSRVARNRASPQQVLALLLEDVSPQVRYEAKCTLAETAADLDMQQRLSEERGTDVLCALAANPACHGEILERLAQHADPAVLRVLATNANLPASIRARLASHPLRIVREAVRYVDEKRREQAA